LPRLPIPPGEDPWANIDEETALVPTVADQGATTSLGARPRSRPKKRGNWMWYALAFAILLALGSGAILAIRYLMLQYG
jgi:hypothetical protein